MKNFSKEKLSMSVVVPVRNEAANIERMATALLSSLPEDSEVVFVCNGCTDQSAKLLNGIVDARCKVLEIHESGKARAIREAERLLTAFPRFYIDSDVIIR